MINLTSEVTIFKTDRLVVRELNLEDFNPYFEMHGNPNVMRYVDGDVESEEECMINLKYVISQYSDPKKVLSVWAIVPKDGGELLGTCALVRTKTVNEIGYRFLEKHWGNGYGTEVTKGLIEYAFEEENLDKLTAYAVKENTPSIKILEKCGLSYVGEVFNRDHQEWDLEYEIENH